MNEIVSAVANRQKKQTNKKSNSLHQCDEFTHLADDNDIHN